MLIEHSEMPFLEEYVAEPRLIPSQEWIYFSSCAQGSVNLPKSASFIFAVLCMNVGMLC